MKAGLILAASDYASNSDRAMAKGAPGARGAPIILEARGHLCE
jgi:hypothetical protein